MSKTKSNVVSVVVSRKVLAEIQIAIPAGMQADEVINNPEAVERAVQDFAPAWRPHPVEEYTVEGYRVGDPVGTKTVLARVEQTEERQLMLALDFQD